MLTVGAPVAVDTVTAVGEPGVPAGSSVPAEAGHRGALLVGGDLTGDLPHVTHLPGPAGGAGAIEGGPGLGAPGSVLTGIAGAPVHQLVTVLTSEP